MNRALITVLLVLIIAASGGYVYYYFTQPADNAVSIQPTKQAETGVEAAPGEEPAPTGMQPGPIVSHTEVESEHTRIRAVLSPRHIAETIRQMIPAELLENKSIPPNIRTVIQEDFANLLPYELALLGGANEQSGRFEFLIFGNQRYLAPLVPMVPQLRGLPVLVPIVEWEDAKAPIKATAPTVLEGAASMPIPESVATVVKEKWPAQAPPEGGIVGPDPITGDELFEVTIDNREGDLLALVYAALEANGIPYERFAENPAYKQQFQIASAVIQDISTARVVANVDDTGALVADVRLNAVESPSAALVTTVPMMANSFAMPMLNSQLEPAGVTIDGELRYDDQTRALVGTFKVEGFQAAVEEQVAQATGAEEAEEPTEEPGEEPANEPGEQAPDLAAPASTQAEPVTPPLAPEE